MCYRLLIEPLIKWLPVDIRSYALEGVLEIPEEVIHQVEDTKFLDYIKPNDRKLLLNILMDCLSQEYSQDLSDYDEISHDLSIPVPIPTVDIVHEIELLLPECDQFVIGRTVPMTMKIGCTNIWSYYKNSQDNQKDQIKFMYDIIPSDSWTISGKKRGIFDAIETKHEFDLSLIPLRTGKLGLPKVEIYVLGNHGDIKMEIDHKNGGENALVVPEYDRVSVSF